MIDLLQTALLKLQHLIARIERTAKLLTAITVWGSYTPCRTVEYAEYGVAGYPMNGGYVCSGQDLGKRVYTIFLGVTEYARSDLQSKESTSLRSNYLIKGGHNL